MENKLRVRIASFVPQGLAVRPYAGQILEVTDRGGGYYQYRSPGDSFTISKQYATLIEEVKESEVFTPESGQVFETRDGRRGVFVQAGSKLVLMYADETGSYTTFTNFRPSLLEEDGEDNWSSNVVKIYSGMTKAGNSALASQINSKNLYHTERDMVWSLKPPVSKEVELTRDYTATVDNENEVVVVGCQRIPYSKIAELNAKIEELKG